MKTLVAREILELIPPIVNISTGILVVQNLRVVSRRGRPLGDILCYYTARTDSGITTDSYVFDYANARPNIDIVTYMCGFTFV